MSHNKFQSYIDEAEEIVVEDLTNFNENTDVNDVYESIKFYIKMKRSRLPNLKKFLMNNTDLYIMNGIHGEIKYDTIVIPKSLHFFRIMAVPFGVCNIGTEAIYKEIFNNLKHNIKTVYGNKSLARQPIRKIGQVIQSVQSKIFEINNREVHPDNKSSYNDEFKKYAHIPPKISEFRVGDKMINKELFTHLKIVNGKVDYDQHIFIASPNGKFEIDFFDRINLLDYLIPSNIEYINEVNEWRLTYSMQDVIDLLEINSIKRAINVDLSCSNNAINNTQTIMNKTAFIESHPYVTVGTTYKKRNKNVQYSPKSINKYRYRQTHKVSASRRHSKTKTPL
jgi:hypothetical protein